MRETTIRNGWGDEDEAPPAPLTREQAQALRSSLPSISPWQVVAAQIVAGLLVSLLCWGVGGRSEVGLSALYGAACIVVPTAVLAAGIARLPAAGPAAAAVGFMVWEGVKMLLTLAMLVLAVKVVPHLSWPALLAALVACLSMNWLALSRQG
ncbi:MAG: ATP synthase subunit I, partial [Burkholderiales bacterium]|nr:ATP synthase subunit I [Burkholderiales bacterium]